MTNKDDGTLRGFDTGATRDTAEGKLDYEGFLSPAVLRQFARFMNMNRLQSDGQLRDSDNWQKGIPQDVYMKSGYRHFVEWWEAHRDVVHSNRVDKVAAICGLMFNCMGYLHEWLKDNKEVRFDDDEPTPEMRARQDNIAHETGVTIEDCREEWHCVECNSANQVGDPCLCAIDDFERSELPRDEEPEVPDDGGPYCDHCGSIVENCECDKPVHGCSCTEGQSCEYDDCMMVPNDLLGRVYGDISPEAAGAALMNCAMGDVSVTPKEYKTSCQSCEYEAVDPDCHPCDICKDNFCVTDVPNRESMWVPRN